MDDMEHYDRFFIELQRSIALAPNKKESILRQAIRDTNCPYLRKMLQILYKTGMTTQENL